VSIAIVIPTVGRPALDRLFASLEHALRSARDEDRRAIEHVVLVDDRPRGERNVRTLASPPSPARSSLVSGSANGPAAARNAGWRALRSTWVVFLDDDVLVEESWVGALVADLARCGPDVAGCQGVIAVPLPGHRRPTDWERDVAGLQRARWATADMAYRRSALVALGGFDERFPRAYREDADLALRALRSGHRLVRGQRSVRHPPGPARVLTSVRRQAGNADDVLMDALHGPRWRELAGAPRGCLRANVARAALLGAALVASAARRPRAAALAGLGWAGATAAFAAQRIAPGPRTAAEVATMALTSALIPPAAVAHRLRGQTGLRRALRASGGPVPRAVLLDRDGTLVVDVPYNGDPAQVAPVAGAAEALERLRSAGCRLAVISNQSGLGRGLLTADRVAAVNARVDELLGPLGPFVICPHAPEAACDCRKPAPGLVLRAAARLGVAPRDCAVVGDIGADVEAAAAAGARGVLVPNAATLPGEIARAPEVARDLPAAVDLLLGGRA
jgi:histidinol-phosphate phosphatase family protein